MGPSRAYFEVPDAELNELSARLSSGGADGRVLFRGGTVITMDPRIGDLHAGDVLVHGDRIEAVAPDLSDAADAADTVVFDVGGAIVAPGLIEAHRHCWQSQFRRLIPDADLAEYLATTHGGLALHYEPEDMYAGNLISLLGLLDSGVTCVLDFSHNSRSEAHTDAVFRAYHDTQIRAVHASAAPNAGTWDEQWPEDLLRMRDEQCRGGLTSVRMGVDIKRVRPLEELMSFAREHGFGLTFDGVIGERAGEIEALGEAALLGPDLTLIHCAALSSEAWSHIADSGTNVTLATTSDQQIGLGDGIPPIQRALDLGLHPSLSADVEITLAGDLFTQMRATLATQRMHATARRYNGEGVLELLANRDVLAAATVHAAAHVGLGDATGTLTPGKAADLIVIHAQDVNNLPLNNAIGTIVQATDRQNIDTVMVGGRLRKWRGELVGIDLASVRRLIECSRDRLAEALGFEFDPVHKLGQRDVGFSELRRHLQAIAAQGDGG